MSQVVSGMCCSIMRQITGSQSLRGDCSSLGLAAVFLTSEGETWRRHRRIMAPAFDRRSVESYAPVITSVTSNLLREWDALPNASEVDIGAAMMHTTLHIISRSMFSTNSEEIVDVVEQGVERYQATVRPSLLDLLAFPAWLTKIFSYRQRTGAVFNEFDKTVNQLIGDRARELSHQPRDLLPACRRHVQPHS